MKVDREVVVWALEPMLGAMRESEADFRLPVPLVFAEDEAGFLARFPPLRNPLGYFIDVEAVKVASAATVALMAARPLTFPPITVFGQDLEALKLVVFNPNSRVPASPGHLEGLGRSLRYWTEVNLPLE